MCHKVSVDAIGGSNYRVTVEERETSTVPEMIATPQVAERYGHAAPPERLFKALEALRVARFLDRGERVFGRSGNRIVVRPPCSR